MNALEARYRGALRWYPRSWRAENGDALIGTLLDVAESEGREVPSRADLRDLMRGGLATRFGRVAGHRARGVIAANAVATGVALSITQFFASSWAPLAHAMRIGLPEPSFGPFFDLGPIFAVLWIAAASGALLRNGALARGAAIAVVLASVVVEIAHLVQPTGPTLSQFPLLFFAALGLLSLLGAPRPRASLGLLLAAWFAVFVVIDVSNHVWVSQSTLWLWVLGPANAAGLTMALAATCLIAGGLANVGRPQSAAIVLVSTTPWLLMWAVEVVSDPHRSFEFPFPLYALGLLVVAYGVSAVLIRRSGRRATPAA